MALACIDSLCYIKLLTYPVSTQKTWWLQALQCGERVDTLSWMRVGGNMYAVYSGIIFWHWWGDNLSPHLLDDWGEGRWLGLIFQWGTYWPPMRLPCLFCVSIRLWFYCAALRRAVWSKMKYGDMTIMTLIKWIMSLIWFQPFSSRSLSFLLFRLILSFVFSWLHML